MCICPQVAHRDINDRFAVVFIREVRLKLRDGRIAVRTIRSTDGIRELVIFRRPDGFFGFAGERFTEEDGDAFWEPAEVSGIYESAESAESAAMAEITWLAGRVSN